ncbi:hypothetical protein BDR22DRAFT_818375 [Usnea florida]
MRQSHQWHLRSSLGATEYIGGDALAVLLHTHPEYEITCPAHNSDKDAQVASQYAKARLVYGTSDDGNILELEAQKANMYSVQCTGLTHELDQFLIIPHLDCPNADKENAVNALTKGLAARKSGKPGFYIHISGNALFFFTDLYRKTYGEMSTKVYNDWDGIGEISSLPDHAPHRKNDMEFITAEGPEVRTAIVCPPAICGAGRGPGNTRSDQIPELARSILEKEQGFHIGAGESSGPSVCIHDLSDCYVKFVEAAIEGGGKAK